MTNSTLILKKSRARGLLAGREWAESGRSIRAVEAVAHYVKAVNRPSFFNNHDRWFATMAREVHRDGQDDEFSAAMSSSDDAYLLGWLQGVCAVVDEWDKKR
jgi:hypothetical protein